MAYTKTTWEDLPSEDTPITSANLQKIEDALAGMLDYFYPVGTIYETTSSNLDTTTKMANHFGGTWEVYGAGRVLVAKSSDTEFDTIGETGGAKTHTLTTAQMPAHTHHQRGNDTLNINPLVTSTISGTEEGSSLPASGWTSGKQAIITSSRGGGEAHPNLQPYIVVYRYRRTA